MEPFQADSQLFGKSKHHKWTEEENAKLVESLIDLRNIGSHNADNGFRAGYLMVLEKLMESKLPGCGLKAKPHIESRLRTLKKDFQIVFDMIYGFNTSGFGWNHETKCVTAEKAVWDSYLQSHSKAAPFRNKAFPHFEELCIVYGNDRATGRDAQTAADVVDEMDVENTNENENLNHHQQGLDEIPASMSENEPTNVNLGESSSGRKKRKKNQSSENMVDIIKDVSINLRLMLDKATDKLCRSIGMELMVDERRSKLFQELSKLEGLNAKDRRTASRKIASDEAALSIFFTLPDEEKEEWVIEFLSSEQ